MELFSRNLRLILRQKKLSQAKLAQFMGVSQQTVNRWANGINEPDFARLLELCRALDTSPDELLGWEEPLPPLRRA